MNATPDLSGKCLLLYLANDPPNYHCVTMENAHFEEQGGRAFIVGREVAGKDRGGWGDGAMANIAWERIEQYYVFESLTQMLDALNSRAETVKRSWPSAIRQSFWSRLWRKT